MNQQVARDIMTGRRRGVFAATLRAALEVASMPYAAAMFLRRVLYNAGVLPRRRAKAPVICIGNVTVGGTGKTPMVTWVVRCLRETGKNPAILTRGYKAVAGKSDEAQLLEQLCDAPVHVGANRAAGAKKAVAGGADVLVMDDGFQHLRLRRNLDIVLLDATDAFGAEHCLPRGLLREPLTALADAGVIVITRSDQVEPQEIARIRHRLGLLAPHSIVCLAEHRPSGVIDDQGTLRPCETLAGKRVFAACALGNPRAFFDTLSRLGATLAGTLALDDHAEFSPQVMERIRRDADAASAEAIVVTQKDYVKFPVDARSGILQLAVEMVVTQGQDKLKDKIASVARG
jgi:tetraacyldisaccharide 4'-kinase